MRKGLLNRIASLGTQQSSRKTVSDEELIAPEVREKRYAERVNTYKDSTLFLSGDRRVKIIIHDMSETGLRIGCDSGHSLPDYVDVMVMGHRYNCRVVWRGTFEAGLEYLAQVA